MCPCHEINMQRFLGVFRVHAEGWGEGFGRFSCGDLDKLFCSVPVPVFLASFSSQRGQRVPKSVTKLKQVSKLDFEP